MTPRISLACTLLLIALAACGGGGSGTLDRRACSHDTDCVLGEVCDGQACVAGCRSARDCPAEAPLCDEGAGASGSCVGCLGAADCERGDACESGTCVTTCRDDADCPGQRCDDQAGLCVDCLSNADCALGTVCTGDQVCEAGCFGERDCDAATPHCVGAGEADPGDCVVCRDDDDCGDAEACVAHACVPSCQDDGDCPGGACDPDSQLCVECVTTADCPLGAICSASACVAGCEGDRDCPAGAPLCDAGAGPHGACVACLGDRDCAGGACEAGECVVVTPGGEGQACSATGACEGALLCDTSGVCRVGCNLFSPVCPRATDTCAPDLAGGLTGVCVPATAPLEEGDPCSTASDACAQGLVCHAMTSGSDEGLCTDPGELVDAACLAAPLLVSGTTTLGTLRRVGPSLFESSCQVPGQPAAADHPEKLYRLVLTVRSQVTLSTSEVGTGFDTLLSLLERCDPAARELACNDDVTAQTNLRSTIALTLEPGTYTVVVDRGFTPEPSEPDPTPFKLRYRAVPL
jgi:hypothetical protein